MPDLAANIAAVRARIAEAARAAGRDPADVVLVAVTKTHPVEVVEAAARAGVVDFGENRVEEAVPKMRSAAPEFGLRWHMIGHVQSRKAADVARAPAGGFTMIHSVDSLKLAERLSRVAVESGRRLAVLLQCNVSGEKSRSGFPAPDAAHWERLLPEWAQIVALPGLRVQGLMTMAPIVPHVKQARPYFRRLRELRDYAAARLPQAGWQHLSMGMTDDFEAAIGEGATLVRIGRAIFGERNDRRPG